MTKETKNNLIGNSMLALCAIIWGSSFVAQTTGAEYVGPFSFIALRSFTGSAFLAVLLLILKGVKSKTGWSISPEPAEKKSGRFFLLGSVSCGVCLCVASVLQQIGIDKGTSPGKAGFITALYIIIVPILSIVLKKKIRPVIWLCVAISILGLYLLCVTDNSVSPSDFYVLICAFCFAVHILVVDYVSPYVDGIKLSCVQFLVCGIIAGAVMLLKEEISLELVLKAAPSILYSGIMSSGIAYTLQILGQQRTDNPTVASMLMSLESVFAVISGIIVLHQVPTLKEALGCILMFAAIIIAQLPQKNKTATK